VDYAPRARLVARQGELERQVVSMALDEGIDAARVGGKRGAVGLRKRDVGLFGDAAQPQAARLLIVIQRGGTEDLPQFAGIEAAQQVHLEETVLGGDVALHEERVLECGGADVGYAERVEIDGGGCRDSGSYRTRSYRQRAPGEPVQRSESQYQENRDCD